MKRVATVCLFVWLLSFLGCNPVAVKRSALINLPSLSDWPAVYKSNFVRLKNLQSKARLTVESAALSTNATVKLIYMSPNTLYLEAEGLLGIDLGKIYIGKKRFIIYNQFNNNFVSGSLDEKYYNNFLQTKLTFRQIKNAVVGLVPIPDNIELADEPHGIFSALVNGVKWRFEIDKSSGFLNKFEKIENGKVILREEFKRYRLLNGVLIPALIRIILPVEREMVSVFHKDLKINSDLDPDSYKIKIGPKVKQLIVSE